MAPTVRTFVRRICTFAAATILVSVLAASSAHAQDQLTAVKPAPGAAEPRIEHWIGTIYLPNASCPQVTFVVTFRKAAGEAPWAATLSITPGCSVGGMLDVVMSEVVYTDDKIQFVSPPPPSENLYDLTVAADKQSARGQLILGRQQAVLIRMRRATADEARDAAPRRPQIPTSPLPYDVRDISITNPDDAVTLSGVVTTPRENGAASSTTANTLPSAPAATAAAKRPAVILIGDENPHDMDQSEGFHKPGLVLADYLTRQGVIVLRFDDRGMGHSGGNSTEQTLPQAAVDVKAAIAVLAAMPEVDPKRIGLIGRGEGATIAALAAADNPQVGFVVLMAPAAVPWKDVLVLREKSVLEAQGEDAAFVKARIERYSKLLGLAASGENADGLREALRGDVLERGNAQRTGGAVNEFQINDIVDAQMEYLTLPRVISSLSVDPKRSLEKLCCPVLALAGELDMHTPAKETMQGVEAALRSCASGKADRVTLHTFARTNHWFQPCNTGFDDEYDKIELTISPEVLKVIGDWIRAAGATP
ncbi:MAG: alpha/beta hydrolase [Pyrinomonadaceae bacterium]|nr:alpha/beta hydrolase [Phycisphaerales bacterium]